MPTKHLIFRCSETDVGVEFSSHMWTIKNITRMDSQKFQPSACCLQSVIVKSLASRLEKFSALTVGDGAILHLA